jgi:hypothetical protein
MAMAKKTVLAIGIEPALADYKMMPGLTAELIRNYIDVQMEQLRKLGYDAQICLIDLGETAGRVVTTAPQSRKFDCIVIGAGLRLPPPRLPLFEEIINLIHAHAPPSARICFNTTPADTVEAVQRWIKP